MIGLNKVDKMDNSKPDKYKRDVFVTGVDGEIKYSSSRDLVWYKLLKRKMLGKYKETRISVLHQMIESLLL